MFIAEALRSKVAAQLRPWLQEEPDMELELGFLRSYGRAKNLSLDPSALNSLMDDSVSLEFKSFKVGEVHIRVSPWSSPSLVLQMRGVDVTLASRETVSKKRSSSRDLAARERKKAIALVDPQGASMHEMIEGLLYRSSSGNIAMPLSGVLLSCCQVQLQDIQLKLQFMNAYHACVLKMNDICLEPELLEYSSFLRGILHSLLLPRKERILTISCNSLEFRLKDNDYTNCITSLMGLSTCVRLKGSQPLGFGVQIAHADIKFSSDSIPLLLVMSYVLSSKECDGVRNGQELWKIAGQKLGCLTLHRTFLQRIVHIVVLWSRYVCAYELLLSLVGYSANMTLKENVARVSNNSKCLNHVKHQWKLINELEEKLPAEAVGRARQIARHRLSSCSSSTDLKTSTSLVTTSLLRILALVSLLWRFICFMYQLAADLFFNLCIPCMHRRISRSSALILGGVSQDSGLQFQMTLSLGELYITLSSATSDHDPISGKVEHEAKLHHVNLPSLCLIMKCLCFNYTVNSITKSLFSVLGELRLHLSYVSRASFMDNDPGIKQSLSFKAPKVRSGIESKIIMWSDPVRAYDPSERDAIDSPISADNASIFVLENNIANLWSKWKKVSQIYAEINFQHTDQPFVLCELQNFLIDPYLDSGDYGLHKCTLTLGKMNLDLDYSSIKFSSLLLGQLQHCRHWATTIGRMQSPSSSSIVHEEKPEISMEDRIRSYTSKLKILLINMIPVRNIQIGAVIGGPSIRIFLQDQLLHDTEQYKSPIVAQEKNNYCFVFDLANIEFAVLPASKAVLAALTEESSFNEVDAEYIWFKEPRTLDILEAHASERYVARGRIALDACLRIIGLAVSIDNLEVHQKSHVVGPMSITIHSSICRDYLRSLSGEVDVLSISLSGITTDVAVYLYADELLIFLQVFKAMFSASSGFSNFDSASLCYPREFFSKLMTLAKKYDDLQLTKSKATDENMIIKNTQILVDAALESESVDIILNDSRNKHLSSMNANTASSSAMDNVNVPSTCKEIMMTNMIQFLSFGIGVFVQKSFMQISCSGSFAEMLINFSKIQSVVFNHQSSVEVGTDILQLKTQLDQSLKKLHQFSLCNCVFSLQVGSHGGALPSSYEVERHFLNAGEPETHSCGPNHNVEAGRLLVTDNPGSSSGCWIFMEIEFGEILMAECCMKTLLTATHQPSMLKTSIFFCEDLQTISCKLQGGLIFLETSTLAMFIECYRLYCLLAMQCFSWVCNVSGRSSEKGGILTLSSEHIVRSTNCSNEEHDIGTVSSASNSEKRKMFEHNFVKALSVDLSQFSLALVVMDGSDEIQELILEADMSLQLMSSGKNLFFDLNRLAIFSQHVHRNMLNQTRESLVPHFCSNTAVALSSHSRSGENILASQVSRSMPAGLGDAHSANLPAPGQEILVETSGFSPLYHGNYILKHLAASIKIEKMVLRNELGFGLVQSDWFGKGSISGFDLTIAISEIQMLLALYAPLCGIFTAKASQNLARNFAYRNQGWTTDTDNKITDGAIVAIWDLHQHMYFAVEDREKKYRLVGALHYSLVGERALFRVRFHKTWRKRVSWISLESLYATNEEGKPLCLNYSPGSGFVEISSSNGKRCALWQTIPYEPESYEDDVDDDYMRSCKIASGNAFYLVNQKNDCAVAFVDGLPEFVKKPGNPFKAKVLNDFSPANDVGRLHISNSFSGDVSGTNVQGESSCMEGERSKLDANLPSVIITIDKVVLTIVHEVSDANDKLPLYKGSMNDIHVTGQILPSKFRIISSFQIAVNYFDAQKNLWREIISPVDSSLFFRSRFTHQVLVNKYQKVPVYFYFGVKQVDISLTELSLDVLLYLVGKLNIAGPYAVRRSMIFTNCCKLQNHSGLSLLCHYADNQDAIIAGKQSASIFLRHASLADQSSESKYSVSVSLTKKGVFSTYPIQISVAASSIFAWRTRAVSFKDSRNFPGPFIVAEVLKATEEGLLLVVSPLLRIHNKSEFSLELRIRRPQEAAGESASVLLRSGDTIDDSMAIFDAIDMSGGSKRALMSLSLGNFLLSVRPYISDHIEKFGEIVSIEWSEDLKGGKAVRLSGVFDKLNYRFRKAFGVESLKSFFSTLHCPLVTEGQHVSNLHFLIRTIGRDVPVMQPNVGGASEANTSPVALQVQREIFIYPTIQVYNLLQSEIVVLLTENHPDLCMTGDCKNIGKQAAIPCGSSSYFYANPALIYFSVTLTAYDSKCEPVNSGDWIKKLHKQKSEVHYLDIELDFGGGKYFASLRLTRAERGILEVTVFTTYTLQNNTELFLLCFPSNQKPFPWVESGKYSSNLPPELGCFLPPKSTRSWFLKSNKVHFKSLKEKTSGAFLDLDMLSGFTELSVEGEDDNGVSWIEKLGVSVQPFNHERCVPSQVVCIVPRYVISNESTEAIMVRQCYLEDGMDGITTVEGKQKVTVQMRKNMRKRRDVSFFDSILRRHSNGNEDCHTFIQFCIKENGYSWSGPICVASLGRFFLKFKRFSVTPADRSNPTTWKEDKLMQFAAVHTIQESSSLVLHFYMPPDVALPYRIENCLCGISIMYYQKDLMESDILASGNSVEYAWDDLNLPHKLVVEIVDMHLLREINIDKVTAWKPLFKMRQNKGLALQLPMDKRYGLERKPSDESHGLRVFKVGYEVYADGLCRVLRICELADSYREEKMLQPCATFQLRISYFAVHFLDSSKQKEADTSDLQTYSTIIVARLGNSMLDLLTTDQYKYYRARIQSINVDEKWQGAPFASMVRKSQLHDSGSNENILKIVFILCSTNSSVKQVKYSSIILQPIDLKVDEETLMRLVPFWRTSLSDSRTQSQQYYFKHFEIHPIKIIASFLPGSPYASYSSAQETLRSLLHSVIKVPAVNNKVVELNGVLLTHALVTFRELLIKCAQHYSWYVIRAVYIAKGSPLLPPAFASIFDDTASSSLDVFFDPSDGSISLPGLTLGMFKFISKCIDSKGFSGTKRYFGDLGKTIKMAGSNALFAAVTEISDSVLRGAETNGFSGMVNGLHQGILRLAMEPSLLGAAVMEGGPNRKIKLDRSPGVDELYIEGYLQAMLDVMYKQEYLRVRVIDDQVILKNLPPNSSIINEIEENVKSFLVSKALLTGDISTASRPLRHLRSESEWKLGPTVLTLCEHLFVSLAIQMLRKHANKFLVNIRWNVKAGGDRGEASSDESQAKPSRTWAVGKFLLSGMIAYLDGRLCRHIPNPIARRIVSGFLLSFLQKDNE
ncbi:uncharacterized protein LOC103709193 isoform X2 [Phoenix dactylifera]|uniref:Uncharacterized protein LOC103709193 isoform X2 n=1 Tax=Phoenix dactylifera TaxID=42345 RepID=A0A8B8Z895_PHODC|nr:uncharacterized protein LOC103709193 isoform X2 [Phoenix dactylifera]